MQIALGHVGQGVLVPVAVHAVVGLHQRVEADHPAFSFMEDMCAAWAPCFTVAAAAHMKNGRRRNGRTRCPERNEPQAVVYDPDQERRNDAVYAEHKKAVAGGGEARPAQDQHRRAAQLPCGRDRVYARPRARPGQHLVGHGCPYTRHGSPPCRRCVAVPAALWEGDTRTGVLCG